MQHGIGLANRLEEARKHCELDTLDAASAVMWPGDPTRRTRYSTVIRTLTHGGSPQWVTLEPIVAYFARRGFHLAWLLFNEGPKSTLTSRRPPELSLATPPSGTKLRRRA